ncbi:SUKH-3 domain-containing protein [Pontimicrobium sp. MEBiC01747]
MNFTNIVQQQFRKAGWIEGRNKLNAYNSSLLEKVPEFLKEFLKEYGELEVLDAKGYKSDVINKLQIFEKELIILSEDKDELDYLFPVINKEIYMFAFLMPDVYRIGCDNQGKIYMLGDYVFHISNSLREGIELLIKVDWSKGYLQLDLDSGVLKPSDNYSGWND